MSTDAVGSLVVPNPVLTPVRRVRSFDDAVAQIRDGILKGTIAPGERLPSERELSELLEVSRTTVREAMRSLETAGLVDIRLGSRGGAFAKAPDPGTLGSALSTLLQFRQASMAELNEFRVLFEPCNASFAALRADEEDLAALRALADRARSLDPKGDTWRELEEIDLEMHEAVAGAAHNQVCTAIMSGIHETLKRDLTELAPLSSYAASVRKDVIEMVALIEARDADGAEEHMRRHLERWRKISSSTRKR
jgi:DNA-binding FadR family transcriptional regulator